MADDYVATHRFARISPRKARLVVDMIRGKTLPQAFSILSTSPRRGAAFVDKVLRSAWGNAIDNESGAEQSEYVVSSAMVDEGPTIYRGRPASQGRYVRIRKRTSHIRIGIQSTVSERETGDSGE